MLRRPAARHDAVAADKWLKKRVSSATLILYFVYTHSKKTDFY